MTHTSLQPRQMVRDLTQNVRARFHMELDDLLELLAQRTGRQGTENEMLDDRSHGHTVRNVAVGILAGEAMGQRLHLQVVGKGLSELGQIPIRMGTVE